MRSCGHCGLGCRQRPEHERRQAQRESFEEAIATVLVLGSKAQLPAWGHGGRRLTVTACTQHRRPSMGPRLDCLRALAGIVPLCPQCSGQQQHHRRERCGRTCLVVSAWSASPQCVDRLLIARQFYPSELVTISSKELASFSKSMIIFHDPLRDENSDGNARNRATYGTDDSKRFFRNVI